MSMLIASAVLLLSATAASPAAERFSCQFKDADKTTIELRINNELGAATAKGADGIVRLLDMKRNEKTLALSEPNYTYEFFRASNKIGRLHRASATYVMGVCTPVAA